MATPSARRLAPRPPEKGVFPLDHFGECKEAMTAYMLCLRDSSNQADNCRSQTKAYLECRMSKELMASEDLHKLGFGAHASSSGAAPAAGAASNSANGAATDRQADFRGKGFVAGLQSKD